MRNEVGVLDVPESTINHTSGNVQGMATVAVDLGFSVTLHQHDYGLSGE